MLKRVAAFAGSPRAVTRGKWICALGAIFSAFAGAFGAAYLAAQPGFGVLTALLLFAGAVMLGTIFAQLFFTTEGYVEQRGRDLRAQQLCDALLDGQPPTEPFVLYLRPFASTDQIDAEVAKSVRVSGPTGTQVVFATDRIEFEEQIEKALRPFGLLVGLGRPLEHIGAGRIVVSDEIWKQAISAMMDHSELIVLLPSSIGGTSWEVGELMKSGRMNKTIVVDPPNAAGARRPDYNPAAEWRNIKAAFGGGGYDLPDDDPDGLLLYFGDQTEPIAEVRLSFDGDNDVRRFARRILKMRRREAKQTDPNQELSHA